MTNAPVSPGTALPDWRSGGVQRVSKGLGSKISGHNIIPGTSFRRRPESSVIYPSTRRRYPDSGFRRSDEYTAAGTLDAFNTGFYSWNVFFQIPGEPGAWVIKSRILGLSEFMSRCSSHFSVEDTFSFSSSYTTAY